MFFVLLLAAFAAVFLYLYFLSQRKYDYWRKQKVPHLTPTTILGNYGDYILLKKFIGSVTDDILKKFPDEPYVGTYYGTEPALLLQDPEVIKLVTTRDFYYFHGREVSSYSQKELVTQNLFFQSGDLWKVSRQNLTPLFSSAKMRNMFHLIEKCSLEFEKILDQDVIMSVDTRKLLPRFTMACICSCVFGIDVNTLGDDHKSNPFINIGQLIFDTSSIRGILNITRVIWPAIFYGVGLKNFPEKLNTFFKTFLTSVFESRHYKPTNRNDFIDLVLNLREKKYIVGDSIHNGKTKEDKKVELPVTDHYMIAQCMVFFAAGFETSATTLNYTLFELAKHPEEQKKAQAEIDDFLKKHDNKLVYDCVTELPYNEMCIDETLRLYPVLAVLAREVMENYTFPSGLTLRQGVRVHIPAYSLHRNPNYFPEPLKFRPERFSQEEKKNIKPHTYIPFGDGGRICIGMRFAKMQMLAGMVTILKKYNVELAEGMASELEFNPRSIVTQPYGGIFLKFTPRDNWGSRQFAK